MTGLEFKHLKELHRDGGIEAVEKHMGVIRQTYNDHQCLISIIKEVDKAKKILWDLGDKINRLIIYSNSEFNNISPETFELCEKIKGKINHAYSIVGNAISKAEDRKNEFIDTFHNS